MIRPSWLGPRDPIEIELCEAGPRDGERGTVQACHLAHGLVTPEADPPAVTDLVVTDSADWPPGPDVAYRQVHWRWDGTTAADGAFRFRRAN